MKIPNLKGYSHHLTLALTLSGSFVFSGCGTSKPPDAEETTGNDTECTEPENPYTEGTGHYAGYEWAEKNGSASCISSSSSFNEGCEEFESQESDYQECESRKKR